MSDGSVNVRALVVEDDETVRTLLRMLLEEEGLDVVETATGPDAVDCNIAAPFDIVLLDLRLPGMDGFEVCRQIRRTSGVPIIMVTAQQDSHDVVAGLECGADDYVTKPYNDRELMARIRAQLRRRPAPGGAGDVVRAGDLEVRPIDGTVTKSGEQLTLTKTEFHLLVQLAESPNRVYSRDELLDRVWGYSSAGDGRLVDTHIRRLRVKVETDPQNPALIQTVRGLGYKLAV